MIKKQHTLWVEKYRCKILDEYIGADSLKEDIALYIQKNDIPHLLFYGPPGTGKTTLAKLIISNLNCDHMYINASDENGIDVVREKVKGFASAGSFKPLKIIILDEADRLTVQAQDALRNLVETYSLNTRFIFTCNHYEKIIPALKSRFTSGTYNITPLSKPEVFGFMVNILDKEEIKYVNEDLVKIVNTFYPDIRSILNVCQKYSLSKTLKLNDSDLKNSNLQKSILDLLKQKKKTNINSIRQIIADNGIKDFDNIIKYLYENYEEPEAIINIAEHQFQSTFVPDKEINFVSLCCKLINI